MAARPLISVYSAEKDREVVSRALLPAIFTAPVRPDLVNFVHTCIRKNNRQPYAVFNLAGHQHSAESWGTGRAVSRIPRVSGGGTHRAGQGAFGNMCRSGRMFNPTKIWRRWHRRVNDNQKRFAIASAVAASGVQSLVLARGHRVSALPEVPLVVSDDIQNFSKAKQAISFLKKVRAYDDVVKANNSKKLRCGGGKRRNRRTVSRLGPLVVYKNNNGLIKAFRNLPGVDLLNVDHLNILKLAPGGHLGRFIIWTESAFKSLDQTYGTYKAEKPGSISHGTRVARAYRLPRPLLRNSDITKVMHSDNVLNAVRPAKLPQQEHSRKKNPLTNLYAMVKLNPLALTQKRMQLLRDAKKAAAKTTTVAKPELTEKAAARLASKKEHMKAVKAQGKRFYRMITA